MYKLFVSDMDGTLLSPTHEITQKTLEEIDKLRSAGIEFIIATGRDHTSATTLTKKFGLQCVMINNNGGSVHDLQGNLVVADPIDPEVVQELVEYFTTNQITYTMITDKNYFNSDKEDLREKFTTAFTSDESSDKTNQQVDTYMANVTDLKNSQPGKDEIVLKMMMIDDNLDRIAKIKGDFKDHENLYISSSSPANIEFTNPVANKGQAVLNYAKTKNIHADEIVSIGDSNNDLSMFDVTGKSFAMANASDEIKAAATNQCPSNNDEGVAQAIDRILTDLNK